jgi:hypothetical protein
MPSWIFIVQKLMPNNFKVFGSNKTKETKQDSQNWLWSPMSEGGEP